MESRGDIPALLHDLGLKGEAVEIGVRDGDFSKWILDNWDGQRLHMVDPWMKQDGVLYNDVSNRDQAHQDSLYEGVKGWMEANHPTRHALHRAYSVDAAAAFPDETFDFVYVDARHDYAGVMEDLRAWWPQPQP